MKSTFEDYFGHLAIETTNACNLKCRMCHLWKEEPEFLSPDDIERVVRSLNSRFAELGKKYRPLVTLTGGEPFLHPKINEIYERVTKLRCAGMLGDVYVISNGFQTESILRFLDINREHLQGLRMDFSIDGLEKNHNFMRGNKKSFQNTVKTIHSIRKKYPEIPVSVKMVMNKYNYKDLPGLYLFCKKNGLGIRFLVMEFQWNGFYNRDGESAMRREMMLTEKQKIEILNAVVDIYKEARKSPSLETVIGGTSHVYSLVKNLSSEKTKMCTSPKKEIFINSHGDVFPCIFRPPLTNVFKKDFERCIGGDEHKKIISESLRRECPMCGYHCNFQKLTKSAF